MLKSSRILIFLLCALWLTKVTKAGTEPYENFIKGKIKKNDTLIVRDEKFKNSLYRWGDIQHLAVRNAVSLKLLDEKKIHQDFSCEVDLKISYLSDPKQDSLTVLPTVKLQVNYSVKAGLHYKLSDTYTFAGAHWLKVVVTRAYSPQFGSDLPDVLQLTAQIAVERQYKFSPEQQIKPYAELKSGIEGGAGNRRSSFSAQRLSGSNAPVGTTADKYLALTWEPLVGAEEYDIEWTTVDSLSEHHQEVLDIYNNMTVSDDVLAIIFRNNASRVTIAEQQYSIPLVYNNDFLMVRLRQAHTTPDGIRITGAWDYRLGSSAYAVWKLNWHEDKLNWQYSATFAEEGKRKDVASYFDGTLRQRQSVTISNTDTVSVIQETVYDEFGRPAVSILPAPSTATGSAAAFLHYYPLYNQNKMGAAFSFRDLNTALCELLADTLATTGASLYYSGSNPFAQSGHPKYKKYNRFIPQAEGYPYSVTQYTADNTGRIKLQGGVGKAFQPDDASLLSHTTKYYYGKPEQWELDQLFGNDVGFAEHYQKTMVQDPNGQLSISYLNASGKTIASALAGPSPASMDTLTGENKQVIIQQSLILRPEQFVFSPSSFKLTATTTYLAAMPDNNVKITYNLKKLLSRYKDGSFELCHTCYYEVTYRITDDCGNVVKTAALETLQIDEANRDCVDAPVEKTFYADFARIGEYQIAFDFQLSRKVMENYTQDFITRGQASGYLRLERGFVLEYLNKLDFAGCFTNCRSALQDLGSRQDFTVMFKNRLTQSGAKVDVLGLDLDLLINRKYDSLKLVCQALENNCPLAPCSKYEVPMRQDVSPGGQYALFDADGNPLEAQINILFQHFKAEQQSVFATIKDPNNVERMNTVFTLDDGSEISPYDENFTLAMLVKYWKPEWADLFLPYHPEYCKLQFCYSHQNLFDWDERVQQLITRADSVHRIPGVGSWTATYNNPAWLLDVDPFFAPGNPGSSRKGDMFNDLLNFSTNGLQISQNYNYNGQAITLNVKTITGMIDFQLYALSAGQIADWNIWNTYTVPTGCRIPDREWEQYKTYYFQLKEKYIAQVRNSYCPSCVGAPVVNACGSTADYTIRGAVGPAEMACATGQQAIVVEYANGIQDKDVTLHLYYAEGMEWDVQFNANSSSASLCVPDSLNTTKIRVVGLQCSTCNFTRTIDGVDQIPADVDEFKYIKTVPVNGGYLMQTIYTIRLRNTPTTSELSCNGDQWEEAATDVCMVINTNYSGVHYYNNVDYIACVTAINAPMTASSVQRASVSTNTDAGIETALSKNSAGKKNAKSLAAKQKVIIAEIASDEKLVTDRFKLSLYSVRPASAGDSLIQRKDPGGSLYYITLGKKCKKGFLPYQFFRRFRLAINQSSFQEFSNVWVARLRPDKYSAADSSKIQDAIGSTKVTFKTGKGILYADAERQAVTSDSVSIQRMMSTSEMLTSVELCNLYAAKTSQFDNYQPSGPASGNQAVYDHYVNQNKADSATYAASACRGNVENALQALETGLRDRYPNEPDYQSVRLNLAQRLMAVCMAGINNTHPHGSSTLPSPTLYGDASFGDAIKQALGLQAFTAVLNPWLIDAPAPHDVKPQASLPITAKTSAGICSQIATLKSSYNNDMAQLAAYLQITQHELQVLEASCQNCAFLTTEDVRLPAQLSTTGAGTCVNRNDISIAESTLASMVPGITEASLYYSTTYTNFLNNRFGFVLSYEDYQRFKQSTNPAENTLCNRPLSLDIPVDPYSLAKEFIGRATDQALASYNAYIVLQRVRFQNTYIANCSQTQASANLSAKQQQYHFTLYYYDQADNLVRTIPPEGVQLLGAGQLLQTQQYRDYNRMACSFNGPASNADQATAFTHLQAVLDNGSSSAVEMWLYNANPAGLNHLVQVDPGHHYLFQTTISGNELGLDIYPLQPGSSSVTFTGNSRHYRATLPPNMLPLPAWQHLVIQGNALGQGNQTPQIYLSGVPLSVSAQNTALPGGWQVTAANNSIVYPDDINTLKHLRLYDRLMQPAEIEANAQNTCLNPQDEQVPWYRFNVPPPGGPTTIAQNSTNETSIAPVYPAHRLATTYAYNSTGQVEQQWTPDGGASTFWYDMVSRLVASQNAKQALEQKHSYTRYDELGRITEVGEKQGGQMSLTSGFLSESYKNLFYSSGNNSQLTRTYYDETSQYDNGMLNAGLTQNFLRKRVAASTYQQDGNSSVSGTYYNYDLGGNVRTLYRQIPGLGTKRIDYEYDLISGKVNLVAYQHGSPDQFYYGYDYDAENRLTKAWSSPDATIMPYGMGSHLGFYQKLDAQYFYYLHGPLARVELGAEDAKVQGVDYAYTLQGWLKGVNTTAVNDAGKDMGQDGQAGSAIGKDAYGYALHYYAGDYKPVSGQSPFDAPPAGLRSLYNGNIGASSVAIPQLGTQRQDYVYGYDQLNRIKNVNVAGAGNSYSENFAYDGNGNILNANRYANAGSKIDELTYHYARNAQNQLLHNRLDHVTDGIGGDHGGDVQSQGSGYYQYDAIGNLIQEGSKQFSWNVYGKLSGVSGGISYGYDAQGNRERKTVGGINTYYLRDAQGNVLATYDDAGGALNWREQHLYGSSRIGMWQPNVNLNNTTTSALSQWQQAGAKQYELTNHLGNVLATVNDIRNQDSNGLYHATVTSAQDYYAFGLVQPGRSYSTTAYRYGFNGKENDQSITAGAQDYGMRIYNSALGRFLSLDPLQSKYPELTPYQFASNRPIDGIDIDGLEWGTFKYRVINSGGKTIVQVIKENYNDDWLSSLGGKQLWLRPDGAPAGEQGIPFSSFSAMYKAAAKFGFGQADFEASLNASKEEGWNDLKIIAVTDLTLHLHDEGSSYIQQKINSLKPSNIAEVPAIAANGGNIEASLENTAAKKDLNKNSTLADRYTRNRPTFRKGVIEDVWNRAKDANGRVYDPNTLEELSWDKFKSRYNQWHMGHKRGEEYRKLIEKLRNGEIDRNEFLKEFNNPANYFPESPKANMSHKYEEPKK